MNVPERGRTRVAGARGNRLALVSALLALAVVGCSTGDTGQPLPPAVPTVEVRLVEHDVAYDQSIPPGRVVFRVTNAGEHVHRLALLPLPEDFPPIKQQLQGDTRRAGQLQARVPDLQPGETGMFAVDLTEGQRYALVDFSEGPDGTMHGRLGIASEFRASAGPSDS